VITPNGKASLTVQAYELAPGGVMESANPTKRKIERQDCIIDARVYIPGHMAITCKIRDITPQGAKLVFDEPLLETKKILVLLPSIGKVWAADIRWRRGRTTGVRFIVGEADLEAAPPPKLKSDVFALRLQVAQLAKTAKRLASARAG